MLKHDEKGQKLNIKWIYSNVYFDFTYSYSDHRVRESRRV